MASGWAGAFSSFSSFPSVLSLYFFLSFEMESCYTIQGSLELLIPLPHFPKTPGLKVFATLPDWKIFLQIPVCSLLQVCLCPILFRIHFKEALTKHKHPGLSTALNIPSVEFIALPLLLNSWPGTLVCGSLSGAPKRSIQGVRGRTQKWQPQVI